MKRFNASYTVEAAIIVPIVTVLVVAVMQICLVLHDQVIARVALERAFSLAESKPEHNEAELLAVIQQESRHFLLSSWNHSSVEQKGSRVKINASLSSRSLLPSLIRRTVWKKTYDMTRYQTNSKEKAWISAVILDEIDARR